MQFSPDILFTGSVEPTPQIIDNVDNSLELSTQGRLFSEILRGPELTDTPLPEAAGGAQLPLAGIELPLHPAADHDALLPQDALPGDESLFAARQDIAEEPEAEIIAALSVSVNPKDADSAQSKRSVPVPESRFAGGQVAVDPVVRASQVDDRNLLPAATKSFDRPDSHLDADSKQPPELAQRQLTFLSDTLQRAGQASDRSIAPLAISTTAEFSDLISKPVVSQGSPAGQAGQIALPLELPATPLSSQSAANPSPVLRASIGIPVLSENWGNALQDRVTWMAGQRIQNAEIRLNPAEMGPIRVQVSVQDDAAVVTFNAHHAQTREAIEAAMPRLREMFSENGLSLTGSTVGDDQTADVHKEKHGAEQESVDGNDADHEELEAGEDVRVSRVLSSALVDTFA